MHTTTPDGTVIESRCDFCSALYGENIMIEGHQGSLLCLKCLTAAYTDLVLAGGGDANRGRKCTMCLEERSQPQWESPATSACVCLRCIKQSATALEKDGESGWARPKRPDGTTPEIGDGVYT
ncbi:MAG: hypothetical protein KF745_07955 [Phycisphaeraceae bacterium]|nr:hypothetical protein [Phycisphaeraceae bacterium]